MCSGHLEENKKAHQGNIGPMVLPTKPVERLEASKEALAETGFDTVG